MTDLLHAAEISVAALEAKLDCLLASEAKEIERCAREKQPLGNGYWEERHAIELRLRAALALREALS